MISPRLYCNDPPPIFRCCNYWGHPWHPSTSWVKCSENHLGKPVWLQPTKWTFPRHLHNTKPSAARKRSRSRLHNTIQWDRPRKLHVIWGQGLHTALREIQDTAFHSGSLVNYEKEREHRISCVLRDLSYPASSVTSHSSRSSSTSVGTKQTIRSNGDHTMPGPCKEMLMLEKQVDKLMARVCHLTSLDHPPKPRSAPPTVKPPWITHHSTSRVRIPPRVWHLWHALFSSFCSMRVFLHFLALRMNSSLPLFMGMANKRTVLS